MNRLTGATTSLALLGAGAIMAFALGASTEGFSVNTIGWILMSVGVAGLFVALVVGTAEPEGLDVTYSHSQTGEHPTTRVA